MDMNTRASVPRWRRVALAVSLVCGAIPTSLVTASMSRMAAHKSAAACVKPAHTREPYAHRDPDRTAPLPPAALSRGPSPDALRARDQAGRKLQRVHASPSAQASSAVLAIDESDDTGWEGDPPASHWQWEARFNVPVHVSLLRVHWGRSAAEGVPTAFRWEVLAARPGQARCRREQGAATPFGKLVEQVLPAESERSEQGMPQPSRRSWFVDADACALRLVIDSTNGGPPIVRDVRAYEGASDVLLHSVAEDRSAVPGRDASGAVDGTYGRHWTGAAGAGRWTLEVALPEPEPIDRVRLVFGLSATSSSRGRRPGRDYGIAFGPVRYVVEASEDGRVFNRIASEAMRDGQIVPIRRRVIRLIEPQRVHVLRVVIDGATGLNGRPDADAMPVIREVAAYRSDDPRPMLSAPWILSVNANPTAQTHRMVGGEPANDVYFAELIRRRLGSLIPALRSEVLESVADERNAEVRLFAPSDSAGEAIETIEADDRNLDEALLELSSPPPLTVLSGSNDWDYAAGAWRSSPSKWLWNPLRDWAQGGIGQLHRAVKDRIAPFLGFCGGAQILALLEARRDDAASEAQDHDTIASVIRRTSGRPIDAGIGAKQDFEVAWPGDGNPRVAVSFEPVNWLFSDIASVVPADGPPRHTSRAFPESHMDAVRPDAFLPDRPLRRFEILASSWFCGRTVRSPGPRDPAIPNASGPGLCARVPEVFRSSEGRFPVIGTQFHPEQRDFPFAALPDPPGSEADPGLFLAAAYDEIVDAYLRSAR